MLRRLAPSLFVALVTTVTVTACAGSPDSTGPLPRARELVGAAADRLRDLHEVTFDFRATGVVPGLPVREVSGIAFDGQRQGRARGEADMQFATGRERYEFVVEDEDGLRLTDSDGTTTHHELDPALAPARLLDADAGLRRLLTGAEDLRTETREELGDIVAYRIEGTLPYDTVTAFLPGIHADVDVKFWVARDGRDLLRIWIQAPHEEENAGAVQLELGLADHNAVVARGSPAGRR